MSPQELRYCEGCTCRPAQDGQANTGGENDDESSNGPAVDSTRATRSFTAPIGWDSKSEGIEPAVPLRSKEWWNKPEDGKSILDGRLKLTRKSDMCGEYVERYLNNGLTMAEISSTNRPIIGIAQTGSDLSPCNSHHIQLAKRVRDGILANGGTPFEFPCHPIQESGKRPTASLDRNLAYLSLTEVLYGYPLDGVVLLTGCDKTTPALLMAVCTVNIPAIVMNVGPMLNGYAGKKLIGSGKVLWDSRLLLAEGKINRSQFMQAVALSAPSAGHCNTMGTASTMNALAEALGMALPGSAAIPAMYRERGACAYQTGWRIVDMVREDIKPSDILNRQAFENAIACNTVIGGSTNAPIHINAIAKHVGVQLDNGDWDRVGYELPLLLNVQPAGQYLCEEYYRAGGLPGKELERRWLITKAIIAELIKANKFPHPDAMTVSGKTVGEECKNEFTNDSRVILPFDQPLKQHAGFVNLKGNLFDSAIMKTSVISPQFHDRFLSSPSDPMAFEGVVAVFDGPEDYHRRIDVMEGITPETILIMRGAGPQGYPGAAEVVNMIPPAELVKQGIELPCIGDGRQSGTCGSPCILNASPEAATGGLLGYLKDGDVVRIDILRRKADVKLSAKQIEGRKEEMGLYRQNRMPPSQTPWQEIYRKEVGELSEGMVLKGAVKYQRVAQTMGIPRRNH